MNYLITCAGNGTRFLRQSIKPPKPLIKVFGKELLLWSLESFSFNRGDKLYITYQKETILGQGFHETCPSIPCSADRMVGVR